MDAVILFTGHRPKRFKNGYTPEFFNRLSECVRLTMDQYFDSYAVNPTRCMSITGMALGFDQAAALASHLATVPFEAFVPCPGYERNWPVENQNVFNNLLALAKQVFYTAPQYHSTVLTDRNLQMVARFGALARLRPKRLLLLSLWDGYPSGTGHCVCACEREASLYPNVKFDHINIYDRFTEYNSR